MEILSWNTQAAKGVDEITSVERIATDINKFADADVICLQEVLRTADNDQIAEFSTQFPDYEVFFGAATDRLHPKGRLEFGNLILTRLPALQASYHKLPQPAEPEKKHMPRQAVELILVNEGEFLRITTLHLDYFAEKQRSAQVKYLTEHYAESCDRYERPSPKGGEEQFAPLPETSRCIYCGDFNLTVNSDDYHAMTQPATAGGLVDCWSHVHNDQPHDPTCGIFDHVQWQEGPHCRDFFFASPDVAERVTAMEVETQTAASDHQPLKITLD